MRGKMKGREPKGCEHRGATENFGQRQQAVKTKPGIPKQKVELHRVQPCKVRFGVERLVGGATGAVGYLGKRCLRAICPQKLVQSWFGDGAARSAAKKVTVSG